MYPATPRTVYEMLVRHLLTVAAFLCCSGLVTGQSTYQTSVRHLEKALLHSKEPTITVLYFVRDLDKNSFSDRNEWFRTLARCEQLASESHGQYYMQVCAEIGGELQRHFEFREAYYYLYKTQKELGRQLPKDKRFLVDFYQSLGLSYYYFKRWEESKIQFRKALDSPDLTNHDRISVYNTLGLIYRDQGDRDQGKYYFQLALDLAKREKNEPWIGILSGNLGHYYWMRREIGKARKLTELDYNISKRYDQMGSAINALTLLIQLDLIEHKTAEASHRLQLAREMLEDNRTLELSRVYYQAETEVLQAAGNYKDALESYRKVIAYNDTLNRASDMENVKKTEFQIEFQRKQAEVSLLHEKKKRDELVIYVLVGITVIVALVFFMIINLISRRRKREKEIAALEHLQFEKELKSTEKEMRRILSNLIEKNELIEHLTQEIDQFQSGVNGVAMEEKTKMLDKLQSFTLLTDDDWLEFKKLFEKLNPGFFTRVLSHFPDLTNAEIRLTTLIKLNLSNLEMSRALGISPDSVRKTSLRLRKKLDMEQHEELVKFILAL